MMRRFELNDYPDEQREENIRSTFLNAANYHYDLKGARLLYDGHFDFLKQTKQSNYLEVIEDRRRDPWIHPDQDNLVIWDKISQMAYHVCAKNYLLLGKNRSGTPSHQILEEQFGLRL